MIQIWLRLVLLLTIVLVLPIIVIQTQPFDDRVSRLLSEEACETPCFIGILPGETTMSAAVYDLDAHEWIANRFENFPSQVQQAIHFDAGVPRITLKWQWSTAVPSWINSTQPGSLTVEDRAVKDLLIVTHVSLGEIFLAFGEPDEATFTSDNSSSSKFVYTAWYADESMLIHVEGYCPYWHYYHFPAQLIFRATAPRTTSVVSVKPLCK